MKRITALIIALLLGFALVSCGGSPEAPAALNDDKSGDGSPVNETAGDPEKNNDDTPEAEEVKVNVTYEQAKLNSGYIAVAEGKTAGLKKDGTLVAFNDTTSLTDDNLAVSGINRADVVKIIVSDYGSDKLAMSRDGKTTVVNSVDYIVEDFYLENVKDVMFTNSYFRDDYLTCLKNDGTIWSTMLSFDPENALIPDINDAVEVKRGAHHESLTVTHADGTVSVVFVGSVSDEDKAEQEAILAEVSSWSDVVVAHGESGDEYFYVALKKDGSVVATGKYAELVKDWKNVAWLDTSYGIIMALTTDGHVLVAGENAEDTIYTNMLTKEVSNPAEWSGIVGIALGTNGVTLGLKSDGTIIGHFGGSEGENGFGPF